MSQEITIYNNVAVEQQALMIAFAQEKGMNSIIQQITEQAKEQAAGLDAATAKGRKELASIAYSVAKAKTSLDNHGKDLVSDAKAKIKIVDNERKTLRDTLDALRDEIRLPVTQFEEAEAARKAEADAVISKCLAYKQSADDFGQSLNSEQVSIRLREISSIEIKGNEFTETVGKYKAETELYLTNLLQSVKEQEQQAAELARLQAEAEEKRLEEDRKQREEAIAEKAKADAEAAAQAKIEQAQRDAEESKRRAELEAQRKIDEERQRVAKEQAEKEAEAKRLADIEAARKNNEEHKRSINAAALQSFVAAGFDENTAKKIVCLIAKGKISNVTINY